MSNRNPWNFHRRVADVRDFGAKGDGSTDDTAAFQAAIEYVTTIDISTPNREIGGGVIYVPGSQTPYIVSNLTIDSGESPSLIGDGPQASVLESKVGSTGTMVTVRAFRGFRCENISLIGNTTDGRNMVGMDAGDAVGSAIPKRFYRFVNCWFQGFTTGLLANFIQRGAYDQIYVRNCDIGVQVSDSTSGGAWRDCAFRSCTIGIKVQKDSITGNTPHCVIDGGIFENNSSIAIVIDSVPNVVVQNSYFEGNPVGIELRQTIGTDAITGHHYQNLHFSDASGRTCFQVGSVSGGGEIRAGMITNPMSNANTWNLSGCTRWHATAAFGTVFANESFTSSIMYFGDNTGAGLKIDGNKYEEPGTFSDGDTTPDTRSGEIWKTANTGTTAITDFDDAGHDGKRITVIVKDGNTDFTHGSGLRLDGSANWTTAVSGSTISFVYDSASGDWIETSRTT